MKSRSVPVQDFNYGDMCVLKQHGISAGTGELQFKTESKPHIALSGPSGHTEMMSTLKTKD